MTPRTVSMTFPSIALALALSAVGCASASDSTTQEDLGTTESSLVEDDAETSEDDENAESGIEQALSGAEAANPGGASDPSEADDTVFARIKTNPGLFYKPAGCITSTLEKTASAVTVTHVFTGCTGPFGLKSFDGTVVSTWSRGEGKLVVTHSTTGFRINEAVINHEATISYSLAGDVWTRTRKATSSGTNAKGKAFTREANFVVTWNSSSKCLTRDGSAASTIGNRSVERKVTGLEVCGVGIRLCPTKGVIELRRAKTSTNAEVTLTIDYEGGEATKVKLPSGKTVKRALVCARL